MKDYSIKEFINKVLTGMSIGIVVALIPGALLGEIAKAFQLTNIVNLTNIATRLLPVIMGLTIAMQFKLTPIQSGTLAITTAIASGGIVITDGAIVMQGIGDVINAGLIAGLAVWVMLLIGDKLKAYTILIVPTLIITVIGTIGLMTLPAVSSITSGIGQVVAQFTSFSPVIAGILIASTFALMIVSPVSTAGVAMAISLGGIGSGAANIGICAAGFGLAISGYKVNGFGTSIAHFLGSPKMQMANMIKKPKIMLPIILNAAVSGAFAGILSIQGTPASAGFGISGLIGPINYFNIVGYDFKNIVFGVLGFVIIPVVMAFATKYLFERQLKLVDAEDYKINFN